jgi:photosystem II stability/assembly factor-like uncharacterized protein
VSRVSFTVACASVLAVVIAAGSTLTFAAPTAALKDVLDTPSVMFQQVNQRTVSGVARHGERLIGVGPRGLIRLSTDGGGHWQQVQAPVSSDLVAVRFIDAKTVWAVGHDAVALRSTDAGATWQRVLDGRSVLKLLQSTYAARGDDAAAKAVMQELQRSVEQSATPDALPAPFLDVWFGEGGEGYLVGAFGLILRTTDHGKTWLPWIDRADNDSHFHYYGISGASDHVYVVGEQGLLLRLDRQRMRFVQVSTPYTGSYFGIDSQPGRLVAYGLRGSVYLSRDDGVQWDKVDTGIDAHIVSALDLGDGRLLLVSQAGHVLELKGSELKARPLQVPFTSEVLGAVAAGKKGLVFAQINGIRVVELAGYSLP